MIHIKGHSAHCPPFLIENADTMSQEARQAKHVHGQVWEKWRRLSSGAIRDALDLVCHKKCVWCESKIGATSFPEIDHYRPKKRYYWLMFHWSNLLLSCRACNITKHSQFPLETEEDRATAPEDDIALERPLLINPALDDPGEHILFDQAWAVGRTDRGRRTIEVLGLNWRTDLFDRRREELLYVDLIHSRGRKEGRLHELEAKLAAPDARYSAMVRSFLKQSGDKNQGGPEPRKDD